MLLVLVVLLTLGLPATPVSAGTLDQSQLFENTTASLGPGPGGYRLAQSFVPGFTGSIDRVDVKLNKPQTGSNGPIAVEIRAANDGLPVGSALGSTTIAAASVPAVAAMVSATFATTVPVQAGTQYALVLYITGGNEGFYGWAASTSNVYPRGLASLALPSAAFLTNGFTQDLVFETYVVPNGPAINPNWSNVPGGATDIAAGNAGAAFAAGTQSSPGGKLLYQYVGGPGAWQNIAGAAQVLALASNGDLLAVQDAGQGNTMYRRSGGAWTNIPGAASDLTAGTGGQIYALGTAPVAGGSLLYRYIGGSQVWQNVAGAASQIAVASDGQVWARQTNGDIYRYFDGAWTSVPGKALKLAAGAGKVYALGTAPQGGGYLIYRFVGGSAVWQPVPGTAVELAVDSAGVLWALQDAGFGYGIYRCTTC